MPAPPKLPDGAPRLDVASSVLPVFGAVTPVAHVRTGHLKGFGQA